MAHTVTVAQSRGRYAISAVEWLTTMSLDYQYVVKFADRMPEESKPSAVYEALNKVIEASTENGQEPKVVVHYTGSLAPVFGLLRKDYKDGRRQERARGVTTTSQNDDVAYPVTAKWLATQLHTVWQEGLVTFAGDLPNLRRLRQQMTGFSPKETRAGNLQFGEEETEIYDDQVVSLMLAIPTVLAKPWGDMRFRDPYGEIWNSQAEARAAMGSRLEAGLIK